ncbi:hypothetical protein L1987_10440 [Smallanthus sonchifolius]|uniref:Uncharacterized protein n=1 Tax=Smallanthus sonchifolius TaxID=185202 RepID=A0ACB9JS28_9ASTR|nr:hypothetical protein L1987_10440 [Smallanthus sonchifolius]
MEIIQVKIHVFFALVSMLLGTFVTANRPRLSILNEKYVSYREYEPLTPDFVFHNYTQTLDHFNYKPESYMTFQQRYIVNSKYWGGPNTSSPIFLYMGAEIYVVFEVGVSGFFPILAYRFHGLLVYIEHRYYGTSMPFGSKDEAYKDANTLGFFSSEQALADYDKVLNKIYMQEIAPISLLEDPMVEYPHIAYGALAASAPILYFKGLTPENGYALVVSNDFNSTSESCYKTIKGSWAEIDRVASQPNGLLKLSQIFNICLPLNTSQELKDNLEYRYNIMAQYNDDDSLLTFCNASDTTDSDEYVLNKIMPR